MKISQRLHTINGTGDDGWGLFYKSRQMIADGIKITELTIGEHDIRTDPTILDAMHRAAKAGHTGYAMIPGTDALRDKLGARITERTGVPTTRDNIVVTPGGQSALYAAHYAALNPGDTGLFIDPHYATYPGTVRAAGGVPRTVIAQAAHGFQPQLADLREAAVGATSLLINSPNNPTGIIYTAQTMSNIAAVCQDADLWLISDEVYDTQIWSGTHISPRSLPGMAPRTLVVGSMSKSHAMTGSRVGWVCASEDMTAHLINLSTNTTYGVPGYIQDAALFALEQGDALERAIAAPFRRRRDLTLKALAGQDIVKAVPVDGAMYAMLDVQATGLTGANFADALLTQEHIAVMPGHSFGVAAAGHIRVAMTIDDDAYVDAIGRLVQFAQKCAAGKVSHSDA